MWVNRERMTKPTERRSNNVREVVVLKPGKTKETLDEIGDRTRQVKKRVDHTDSHLEIGNTLLIAILLDRVKVLREVDLRVGHG